MSPGLVAALVGLGAFSAVMVVYLISGWTERDSAGRLRRMSAGEADPREAPEGHVVLRRAGGGVHLPGGLIRRVLSLFPAAPESVRAMAYPQLVRAGYHRPDTVNVYFGMKILMMLVGLALFGVVTIFYQMEVGYMIAWAFSFGALGYLLPDLWLSLRIRARQQEIRATLPDALDLMVICLEAGLGMESTMTRVGKELEKRGMPLGSELTFTSRQIEAGKPRNDALRALALRTDIQEIRNLLTLLIQTERLGTGVADTLRTASDAIRVRKLQKAEAAAARTSVKIIFPLVMCMLPATFVVLLGPAFIPFLRAFSVGTSLGER